MSPVSDPPVSKSAPTADFRLRPGRAEDFEFARALYFTSMKPLLQALNAWNATEMERAFQTYFNVNEIRIITLNGEDVGWIQVSCTEQELCLDQVHLVEGARNKGIGTRLIEDLIAKAAAEGKDVSLSLVKGNRALALYKRMGFEHVAEDSTKIHKRYVNRPAT